MPELKNQLKNIIFDKMPKITKNQIVRNGYVYGTLLTKTGYYMEFKVCPVEQWEELDEEDARELTTEVMWNAGIIQVKY
jgi:hypothetical protein